MGNQQSGEDLAAVSHDLNLVLSEKVQQPLLLISSELQ